MSYEFPGLYDLGMLSWGFTQLTLVSSDLSEFAGYCTRIALIFDKLSEFGIALSSYPSLHLSFMLAL